MCGIAGIFNLKKECYKNIEQHLQVMNTLQKHRGPDGEGVWAHDQKFIGFSHVRLSIIDIEAGAQPMYDSFCNCIVFNGEIYNYKELRTVLKNDYTFKTQSDTEVILAAYKKWGKKCLDHLRGMFAFALWDETQKTLFCARDRFGIKPFYYTIQNNVFYFASEIKTLLPFVQNVAVNEDALISYLTFQFVLNDQTLFCDINKLKPGYFLHFSESGSLSIARYWDLQYNIDFSHSENYFIERTQELLQDSVKHHVIADVKVGSYLSGGLDSSIICSLGSTYVDTPMEAFVGKFTCYEGFDESNYAHEVANGLGIKLFEQDITSQDFIDTIRKIIWHLDEPVAGPGSFPQYCISKLVAKNCKVVLGGQGGDEIFGGYTRYLIAYFEQCIKGAIDNTLHDGKFIVTYESIIPPAKV